MNNSQFEHSKAAIKTGSKSFRLASLVLDEDSKLGAYILYRWCRYCDDVIDSASTKDVAQVLEMLYEQTENALSGATFHNDSAFSGLYQLSLKYNISKHYFFELLEGFKMDVNKFIPQDFEDLKKYCYHVAGVVGLLMSHILKASDKRALYYADSLGRAMQLTNISRDIAEDFSLQRIYIPLQWLQEKNIEPENFIAAENQDKVYELVLRLLESADVFYSEGRKGFEYLPFRAAWSISVASYLYQGIGLKIKKLGKQALLKRTVLSSPEKIKYFILGTVVFFQGRFKTAVGRVKEGSV